MKASADIYLDTRPNKDGLHNVKIKITFNRVRKYFGTDIYLTPESFDKVITAKRRTTEEKEILTKINKYYTKAERVLDSLDVFSFDKFEQAFIEGRDVISDVSFAFDEYIDELENEGRIATASSYRCAKNSLEEFRKGVKFVDVTPSLLKKYERWMLDKERSRTTIGIYLRSLRTIFNRQDIDQTLYPFGRGKDKYEIPSGRNLKKALTLDEISRIYRYEAKPGSNEEMSRDYWIFLYLCNGINVKDFCLLKWEDINGDILTYQREKTKRTRKESKKITVSLKPETWEIINKWGQRSVVPGSYIFPHYEKGMTAKRKHEVSQQLVKTMNKYMKDVAKNVGVNKDVTTYFARHSFATILKRSGTDISMISDLLGHSSLNTTESYLDSFEDEQIKKQTDVLTSFNKTAL